MTEVNKDVLSTSADTRTGTTQTGRPTRESHADYERSPLEPAHASKSAQRPRSGRETRPRGVVAPLEEVCFQPEAESAICVQRFDDSLNSAIRTTYRISLRSSSLLMPRYPSTRVVYLVIRRAKGSRGGGSAAPRRSRVAPKVCRSRVRNTPHATRTQRATPPVRTVKYAVCG